MNNLSTSVILGITQGLTEFFPISSSAHLIIVPWLLNLKTPSLFFDCLMHLGTLLSIFVFWFSKIKKIAISFFRLKRSTEARIGFLIIIGSIPTGILGILGKDLFERMFEMLYAVTICLFVNSIILFLTRFFKERKEIEKMGVKDALIIGLFQGIAILPGISRSGACISSGLFLGLKKAFVFEFAFLLGIPAILGAFILKLKDALEIGEVIFSLGYFLAFISSFLTGLLALKFLSSLVRKGKVYYFAYYCFFLGLFMLCHLLR